MLDEIGPAEVGGENEIQIIHITFTPIEPASHQEDQSPLSSTELRLRYLEEEIKVAKDLIRETEWGLKGLKDHLKSLTDEQSTILSNPGSEDDY